MRFSDYYDWLYELFWPSVRTDSTGTLGSPDTVTQIKSVAASQSIDGFETVVRLFESFVPVMLMAIIGLIIWKRMETRKAIQLALVEKGLSPFESAARQDSTRKFGALRFGMLLVGASLGLTVAMIIWNVFHWAIPEDYRPLVAITSMAFFCGLALLLYNIIATSLEKI
jgi:hypothetical protein